VLHARDPDFIQLFLEPDFLRPQSLQLRIPGIVVPDRGDLIVNLLKIGQNVHQIPHFSPHFFGVEIAF
jgi:hypothetical protein